LALHLPPAVSISRFIGGYKSVSDYTDLADTETNDAVNTLYGPNGDIDQRLGSVKLLATKLTSSSDLTTGKPITGHYWFDKLGNSSTFHVVAAGNALYQYNSATASRFAESLTEGSLTFFSFIQIQDPRSASDDILVMTNGVDAIKVWNGSGTAVNLSGFTSASGVPIAKYILNHKERIYAFNIIDSTDADAGVLVKRTGFGTDGVADPHRFTESFYVGGSSRAGELRGGRVLNDQVYFYTRNSVWKFSPSSGDLGDLQELQGSVGLLAPFSLVDVGNFHVFLSERGVYAFDGLNFVHLSEKVDEDLLTNSNLDLLQYAKAVYNKKDNQYILYYPSAESSRNDTALVYDLREGMKCWQPPVKGRQVNYISTFDDSDGLDRVIYGDYKGYLYRDGTGSNDGLATGYNGTVEAASYSTLTDSDAQFTTAGDGLAGLLVRIYEGTGEGQERIIESNTSGVLTLENDWTVPPDTTSLYTVGGINAYWRSKDFEFGNHDLVKLFRHIRLRCREEGNFDLIMHYIVDFRDLAGATRKAINLLESGFAWGAGIWGQARWGARATIRKKISLRNTSSQSTNGTHLAVRFSNQRANESFRISGFDMELKPIGKR
jgi:hypothetical protein